MERLKKSKRVAWASGVNLCQVRLFLLEESPSQVGMAVQHQLNGKVLGQVQSGDIRSDDNLPPGFEGIQPSNLLGINLLHIPLMKWKCPPRFELDSNWRVEAGKESAEVEAQNQRELRVLEAIYPRTSAIPPNPSALLCSEASNDQNIPVVPMTAIEDEVAAIDDSFGYIATNNTDVISSGTSFSFQGSATPHPPRVNGSSAIGIEPGIATAAQAAFTSVLSSNSGTLIDHDLLSKILGNPKTIEHLLTSHCGASSSSPQIVASPNMQSSPSLHARPTIGGQNVSSLHSSQGRPVIGSQHMPSISTPYSPNSFAIQRREPLNTQFSAPSVATPYYPPPPAVRVPIKKDINYFKSLIQQHGGEKREIMPQFPHQSNHKYGTSSQSLSSRDSKPKIMRPCMYFNSEHGCRNGENCVYQHDISFHKRVGGVMDVPNNKRMKFD